MRKLTILFASALVLFGCKEKTLIGPYGTNDGDAPNPVSNVTVRNFSGGSTLFYDLPSDLDLSYIRARYVNSNGEACEAMASKYVDSLVLRGFGVADNYDVSLYAVDRFENESEPVTVTISPTTAPIRLVFNSLVHTIGFGGFTVDFENVEKAEVGIYITRKNSATGEQEYYDSYFTSKSSGSYAVRGLPAEENDFGIYVQDKWNNKSDTLFFTGTPYFEEELLKNLFSHVDPRIVPGDLPLDQYYDFGNERPYKLWDGIISDYNYCNTLLDIPFPHRFTLDLGVVAKLSRLKIWQRIGSGCVWKHAMWKRFNIYGCAELPDRSGSGDTGDVLSGWTLLGEFESVKPSGSPVGIETDEDMQLARDGEEFNFSPSNPEVRYVRFEIRSAHSMMRSSGMSEISLWGQCKTDKDTEN